jgi:hypothetical protein
MLAPRRHGTHPKSRAPHPLRLYPEAGYGIHFDPFGPFADRFARLSLLCFDTLTILKALVSKIEPGKGSGQWWRSWLADSYTAVRSGLHFSRLFLQKFNAVVERPIRTVVEVVAVIATLTLRISSCTSVVPLWRFNGSRIRVQ